MRSPVPQIGFAYHFSVSQVSLSGNPFHRALLIVVVIDLWLLLLVNRSAPFAPCFWVLAVSCHHSHSRLTSVVTNHNRRRYKNDKRMERNATILQIRRLLSLSLHSKEATALRERSEFFVPLYTGLPGPTLESYTA